jgi:hypothetical protein
MGIPAVFMPAHARTREIYPWEKAQKTLTGLVAEALTPGKNFFSKVCDGAHSGKLYIFPTDT